MAIKRKNSYSVSVDIGVNALGFSVWDNKEWKELVKPTEAGIIEVPKDLLRTQGTKWRVKVDYLMIEFEKRVLQKYKITHQFIEWAENRDGAVGNAASKKGYVSQLAYAAGRHEQLSELYKIKSEIIPVSEWKQTMPKDLVELRIKRAIGNADILGNVFKSHAIDAVGIGLYCKGFKLDNHAVFGEK